ncbi:hypothetical protein Nmel_014853 [Mimus melanotis]
MEAILSHIHPPPQKSFGLFHGDKLEHQVRQCQQQPPATQWLCHSGHCHSEVWMYTGTASIVQGPSEAVCSSARARLEAMLLGCPGTSSESAAPDPPTTMDRTASDSWKGSLLGPPSGGLSPAAPSLSSGSPSAPGGASPALRPRTTRFFWALRSCSSLSLGEPRRHLWSLMYLWRVKPLLHVGQRYL